MCDPFSIATAGLSAMKSVGQISAQNNAAVENSVHAKQAMNDEQTQTTAEYIEQNRSLVQGGFDAILEGRENEATAYASAIENGVQGASVKAVMRDHKRKSNRSAGRTAQEMDSLKTQTGANLNHIRTKAQGRINSVSTTSFGLGDVAGVLAPIVKSQMD